MNEGHLVASTAMMGGAPHTPKRSNDLNDARARRPFALRTPRLGSDAAGHCWGGGLGWGVAFNNPLRKR